jgi:outer membrane protein assembly factor BamD
LITQFPNSKYARGAEQKLREIQELLAEAEMAAGDFYHHKGAFAAAASRLNGLVEQYPLFSRAPEALFEEADAYAHMGPRFRKDSGDAYAKIVRDYPLSSFAELAKKKLQEMEIPVPEADPSATARMKYEAANHPKPTVKERSLGLLKRGPDVSAAARSGQPTMDPPKKEIPKTIPVPSDATTFTGEVTVAPVTGTSALDTQPDARTGAGTTPAPAPPAAGTSPRQ